MELVNKVVREVNMKKLQKDYVVDSILNVKRSSLQEVFVTELECRLISKALEEKLREKGHCIEITYELENNSCFEVISQEIIIEKSPNHIHPLKSYICDEKVRKIVYDEEFIASCLYLMRLKNAKNLARKMSSNE